MGRWVGGGQVGRWMGKGEVMSCLGARRVSGRACWEEVKWGIRLGGEECGVAGIDEGKWVASHLGGWEVWELVGRKRICGTSSHTYIHSLSLTPNHERVSFCHPAHWQL